jgi:hypothetical protein
LRQIFETVLLQKTSQFVDRVEMQFLVFAQIILLFLVSARAETITCSKAVGAIPLKVCPVPPSPLIDFKKAIDFVKDDTAKIIDDFCGPYIDLVVDHRNFDEVKCQKFIDDDGMVGDWGKIVMKAVEDVGPSCFYGDGKSESSHIDYSDLCPNFNNFSPEKRKHFVVNIFAKIAMIESACNPNATAVGTNDTAVGLLQMEDSFRKRKGAGRDSRFCPYVATDMKLPENNLRCGVSIMHDQLCGPSAEPRSTKRALNSFDVGYWQKLRKNREISQLVAKYPGCKK